MSKIVRKTSKIFASTSSANEIAQFGSLAASAPAFSTDPATIQGLSNWTGGWFNAVENVNSPAIEDMNAVHFVNSYQVSYLLQEGIPEWDSGTTYYIGSIAQDGVGNIYVSQQNSNVNNVLSNATYWSALSSVLGALLANGTIPLTANWSAGNFTITANGVQLGSNLNTIAGCSVLAASGQMVLETNGSTAALTLSAAQNATFGGNVTISGTGTLTVNGLVLGASANTISNVSNMTSGGSMVFKTNGSTAALSLDASQNATFAGQIVASPTSNQLKILPGNSGNYFQITATNPGQNTTLTIPDPGNASANILLSKGGASVSGAWSFGSTVSVTGALSALAASNQVVIQPGGSGNAFTFTAATPGQATTLTIPDPGNASANVLLSKGTTSVSGAWTFSSALTTSSGINGVTDASTASAGIVGQVVTAFSGGGGSPVFQNAPSSTNYGDVASITLTAGDYDVWASGESRLSTATGLTAMQFGISTTTGNSSAGLVSGQNIFGSAAFPTVNVDSQFHVPSQPVSVSGSTTYYLKMNLTYSGGTPQARGTLFARRRR